MGWFDKIIGRKDSVAAGFAAMSKLGKPVWSSRNYEAFAHEAYSRNVIAYSAIRMIAQNAAAIPLLAYDDRKNEIIDHPFLKVLKRPNPWQGYEDFIDELISFWRISGNGYIEGVALGSDIKELHALRPDRMKAIAGRRGYPSAWRYTVEGKYFDFDMELHGTKQQPILHVKDFSPIDDWYGMSPIEAGSYAIDVHNAASGFNKALLDNSASPSGAFQVEGEAGANSLTKDQFDRLKSQMTENYAGAKNAGRMMLLEGGLKWVPMGMTLKDLQYTDGKNQVAREIALAFGVPPMLLGIAGDNTFSNYREANRAFHRQTVIPLLCRLLGSISNWVQPTYPGLNLKPDVDQIDALADEREAAWKRVGSADFLTPDEKREALGYSAYQPTAKPGGRIMVNGGLMPIEDALDNTDFSGGPEPVEAEKDNDADSAAT
ncbi:MAG: phage portal protein [Ahrensia sp.]|nr:phage portal protein [Ahrensia sp.]